MGCARLLGLVDVVLGSTVIRNPKEIAHLVVQHERVRLRKS